MRRLANLIFALGAFLVLVLQPQSAQARWIWPTIGAQGDASAAAECPAPDQVLVGFGGRTGLWIDQIQLICAPMLADGTHGAPIAGRDRFGGTGGGPAAALTCDGRSQMFAAYFELTGDSKKMAYIMFDCIDSAGNSSRLQFGGSESQTAASKQNCGILFQGCEANEINRPRQTCSQENFTGLTLRFGEHVNAVGIICDRRVAAAAPPPPVHAQLYKPIHRLQIAPHALAPVAMFGGKWETVTNSNAHYDLILQPAADGGVGPMGVAIPMQVGGSFTNTDGAHQYDGTISGVVPAGSRRLVYTFTQNNGQSGNGTFTLSADGNMLAGGGDENGTHFTWSGHRAPSQ